MNNERIVARRGAALTVRWKVPRAGKGVKRFATVQKSETVELANVSVVGLGIVAPTARDLRVGSRIPIAFEGEKGNVLVKWLRPEGDEKSTYYGCELVRPSRALVEALLSSTEAQDRAEFETFWDRAH